MPVQYREGGRNALADLLGEGAGVALTGLLNRRENRKQKESQSKILGDFNLPTELAGAMKNPEFAAQIFNLLKNREQQGLTREIQGQKSQLSREMQDRKEALQRDLFGGKADLQRELAGGKGDLQKELFGLNADLQRELVGLKQGAKQGAAQQKEEEQLQQVQQDLQQLSQLGSELGMTDTFPIFGDLGRSGPGIIYEQRRAQLEKNPLVKKYGIIIPKASAGLEAREAAFQDAFQKLGISPQDSQGGQFGQRSSQAGQDFYRPQKGEPQEGSIDWLLRNLTSGASSAAGGLAGVPKNIADLLQGVNSFSKSIAAPLVPEELRQQYLQPGSSPYEAPLEAASNILPSAAGTKETIGSALPEDYLKPRNQGEKVWQDINEDIGSMLFPAGGSTKGVTTALKSAGVPSAGAVANFLGKSTKSFAKKAALSGAGNITKEAARRAGFTPLVQEGLKAGAMLMTGMKLEGSVKQQAADMYNEAKPLIGPEGKVKTKPVLDEIDKITKEFLNTGDKSAPYKLAVKDTLDAVGDSIFDLQPGTYAKISDFEKQVLKDSIKDTSALNLLDFKQDIGNRVNNLKDVAGSTKAAGQLKQFGYHLGNVIKDSPDVSEKARTLLKNADPIWSNLANAETAINNIRNNPYLQKQKFSGLRQLIGIGAAVPELAQTAVREGGAGLAQLGYSTKHLLTVPAIRDQYLKFSDAALRNAIPAMNKEGAILNQLVLSQIKKQEKQK